MSCLFNASIAPGANAALSKAQKAFIVSGFFSSSRFSLARFWMSNIGIFLSLLFRRGDLSCDLSPQTQNIFRHEQPSPTGGNERPKVCDGKATEQSLGCTQTTVTVPSAY